MMNTELICRSHAAMNAGRKETSDVGYGFPPEGTSRWRACALALVIAGAGLVAGCISVNAPDKPIVIELNMNITMDVVYKLSGDATRTVDTNKEIF